MVVSAPIVFIFYTDVDGLTAGRVGNVLLVRLGIRVGVAGLLLSVVYRLVATTNIVIKGIGLSLSHNI